MFFNFAHARQHAKNARHTAHALHLFELFGQILEREEAFFHPCGNFLCLFGVHGLGGFFHQSHNVAHAQNTIGKAHGVENLELIDALANPKKLNRHFGDVANRQGGTAAAIAIGAGEQNARERHAGGKLRRDIHRFLAGQTIGDQQNFIRFGGFFNRCHFRHQRLIGIGAACCIEHHHVKTAELGGLFGPLGNFNRRLADNNRQGFDANLFAQYRQLLHRSRALSIERRHQNFTLVFIRQPFRQFTRAGGFTRALQADHHNGHGRHGFKVQRLGIAKHIDQRIIHNFDDLLTRGHRF